VRAKKTNGQEKRRWSLLERILKGCSAAAGCAAGLLLQKPERRGQLLSLFKIQARKLSRNWNKQTRTQKGRGEKETQRPDLA